MSDQPEAGNNRTIFARIADFFSSNEEGRQSRSIEKSTNRDRSNAGHAFAEKREGQIFRAGKGIKGISHFDGHERPVTKVEDIPASGDKGIDLITEIEAGSKGGLTRRKKKFLQRYNEIVKKEG
jgi:hypothetical protein